MCINKRYHGKIRVFSTGCRINSNKKWCVPFDLDRKITSKHSFEVNLSETLIATTKSYTSHFRFYKVRSVTHNSFQPSMFILFEFIINRVYFDLQCTLMKIKKYLILPPGNKMLHMHTIK